MCVCVCVHLLHISFRIMNFHAFELNIPCEKKGEREEVCVCFVCVLCVCALCVYPTTGECVACGLEDSQRFSWNILNLNTD